MKTVNWMGYEWITKKPDGSDFHADNPHMWYWDECARVLTSGVLSLEARYNPKKFVVHGKEYNPEIGIGIVSTKKAFSYGKFEACLKLPQGNWLWPAFWMTGAKHWPPEIDVFEGYSNGSGSYFSYQFFKPCAHFAVRTNAWKGEYPKQKQFGAKQHKAFKRPEEYNYFTMIWEPKKVEIFFNSKLVRTFKDKKLLNQMADGGMKVILNNGCRNDAKNLKMGYVSSSMFVKSFIYEPR